MKRIFVNYERVSSNGIRRRYRKEFSKAYDAFEYMRKKTLDKRNERVKGYVHHEIDGVTYVTKLSL